MVTVCAALTLTAAALRVGDVVDYALSTDIRAFIDGYEIPAYNIGGRLGVVAEDLRGYGFTVTWNQDARSLQIVRDETLEFTPASIGEKARVPIGTPLTPVLYTDIVTSLDGKIVESFNIDGRTIIRFSELSVYGSHLYDNDVRMSMLALRECGFATVTLDIVPEKIIHAGGTVDSFVGSNSLEALENSYALGHRFMEMDFVLSSDGIPVCLHDWSNYYSSTLSDMPITAEEFLQVKIFDAYTSLTLDTLVLWLAEHPDVYIVTDIKEDNVNVLRHIANEHPEIVPRLIPQIYQYAEYAPVRAMGYSNIILTLYRLPTYEEKINGKQNAQFAKSHGLLAVTADVTLAKQSFVRAFAAADVPLFVHTVNDPAEQEILRAMGVSGFYTDYAE